MKHVFALLAFSGALSGAAQPTFEYADFPTTPIQFDVYVMLDAGGTLEPTDGPDQTWQYSAMSWLLAGTAIIGPASSTPYAGDYPDANIAWTLDPSQGATEYHYYALSPTGFETIATEVPMAPDVYTDPQQILQFPLSLGGSFTDTYASTSSSGTVTWTFTGHGTFITTEGSFPEQIKMKNSNDDVVIWNASPIHPRFFVIQGNVFLFVASSIGIGEESTHQVARLYPSPCGDELSAEGLGTGSWRITDLTARTLLSGRVQDPSVQRIDVSQLPSGTYILLKDVDQRPARFVKD